jgi:methionyl-tRNA synthetase
MSKKIFIGGAWPYANGSLHLGHVAALLPGDILARYFRLKGSEVLYVSGSDCHGTPISIRANSEKVAPKDITDRYHREFSDCFSKLGFSYDLYTRTDEAFHHKVVQEIFLELYNKGIIYNRAVEQTYCERCKQFLPDRYVEGICPHCGNAARGDQCDFCSALLDPIELKDRKCKLCGNEPKFKDTEHLFIDLPSFQQELENYLDNCEGWRENAIDLTKRYLKEGLKERAATRDLSWGIDVPVEGFEDKKIYVWIEAVSGYLSASKKWAKETGGKWEDFWKGNDITAYYVHGKDNIPFHTLILPALLLGVGDLRLPDRIISSEYLTIEGKKLSTSRNWAIWVPYILENYQPDSIRYFLTINAPEKRDGDFSWREFILGHNAELLGAFGNFVNRSLVFINKSFEGKVPKGTVEEKLKTELEALYISCGKKIEDGNFKSALEDIFSFVRSANKYFDDEKPWIQVKDNLEDCSNTLYNCVVIIANLSNLLTPFIPFSCDKIRDFLYIEKAKWSYIEIEAGTGIKEPQVLFERIDKKKIDEEVERLHKSTYI